MTKFTFRSIKAHPLFFSIAIMAMLSFLGGCGPTVVPATQHDPSSPDTVKFYSEAPKKYEMLGTLNVPIPLEIHFDKSGNADQGFELIQAAAAQKGANGVLLVAAPGESDLKVTVGFKGTFYQVPVKQNPRTAVAQAIWVIEDGDAFTMMYPNDY